MALFKVQHPIVVGVPVSFLKKCVNRFLVEVWSLAVRIRVSSSSPDTGSTSMTWGSLSKSVGVVQAL